MAKRMTEAQRAVVEMMRRGCDLVSYSFMPARLERSGAHVHTVHANVLRGMERAGIIGVAEASGDTTVWCLTGGVR
jgi:hypothetical protein